MLIVIHNLPIKVRYSEVKAVIKERCNIQDFILDNLVYESPQSRKITVGLSDESDANKLTKELNGLVFMGQKLYIEGVRKNKRSRSQDSSHSSQGYSRGNMTQNTDNTNPWMPENQTPMQPNCSVPRYMPNMSYNIPPYMSAQRTNQNPMLNDQGNCTAINDGNKNTWPSNSQPPIKPVPAVPQYMQNNQYDIPFYMYGQGSQGSPSCAPVMTPAQPSYGSPSVSTMHNTNMGYGGPSEYDNNQQPKAVSTITQPDYVPCANENSQDKYYKERVSTGYFENIEQQYRDRSRPLCSRDECDHKDRSLSGERRCDDWNASDMYQQSGTTKVPSREDRYRETNLKPSEDSYRNSPRSQSFQEYEPDRAGYKQLATDHRPSLRNEGSFETLKDDQNRYNSNANDNYNLPSKKFEYTIENSRYKWIKPKEGTAGGGANFNGSDDRMPSQRKVIEFKGNDTNQLPNPKNQTNVSNKLYDAIGNAPQSSNSNEPMKLKTFHTRKSIQRYMDALKTPIEHKDETWKCQAISKIVKDTIEDTGFKNFAKKPGFMQFFKSLVRNRINKMLGKRIAVPYETIIEEYDKMYPPYNRKCFILEASEKFIKGTDFPSRAAFPIRKLPVVLPVPQKRKSPPRPLPKLSKKKLAVEIPRPPMTRPPSPGPLPKYPNADKKMYKKLKDLAKKEHEKEIYTLEPKLKEAVENEMKQLEELFKSGCVNNDGGDDSVICKKIENISEELIKVIKLDITKRLLNVNCNLPLRMFANGRYKVREIGPKLKPYGIISCKKTKRSKHCVVVCKDYPYYDYLCTQGEIDIGDGLIITFKPLHLAGPRKSERKNKKKTDNADHESKDEVDEAGDDEAGDDDVGGDDGGDDDTDSDDEMNTWHDEKNVDQKHDIEIIDNIENKDLIEVKAENVLIKKEDSTETVVQCQDDGDNAKTLLKDIKELTETMIIDNNAADADEHKVKCSADSIDVSNIMQDDLEDY